MKDNHKKTDLISESDYQICLHVLDRLIEDPDSIDMNRNRHQVFERARSFYKTIKKHRRKNKRVDQGSLYKSQSVDSISLPTSNQFPKSHLSDADLINGADTLQVKTSYTHCYCCNQMISKPHQMYASMCEGCGDYNQTKRHATIDLNGRIAIVTGGRVKLGFSVAQRLLRCGAQVIITTRFPHDAATRFAACPDFNTWHHKLRIYPLDLRSINQIQAFTEWVSQHYSYLDILINNAAQTIRRPPSFYEHLMELEQTPIHQLSPKLQSLIIAQPFVSLDSSHNMDLLENEHQCIDLARAPTSLTEKLSPAELSQKSMPGDHTQNERHMFPYGQLDADGQQLDLRSHNSWLMRLQDVPLFELVEVQMINSMAPFILLQSLGPLLEHEIHPHRFVINVTAKEGHFKSGRSKSARHPHTNMSKAALNMLTHTVSGEYKARGIFINNVDPGWVSLEFPYPFQQKYHQSNFHLPLDYIDGAARICDPIFEGIKTGNPRHGKIFKNYKVSSW